MASWSPISRETPVGKGRIEAFSDGVFAIIITIMVLELHTPDGDNFQALRGIVPALSGYVLSFVYVGIYWNNHHHLLQASNRVDGLVLWANLHLLFWLSLVPFASRWMGDSAFAGPTVAVYGTVLWGAGVAYYLLSRALVRLHGDESVIASAIGRDWARLERAHLARAVHRIGADGSRVSAGGGRDLRVGCVDVARARSPHRTGRTVAHRPKSPLTHEHWRIYDRRRDDRPRQHRCAGERLGVRGVGAANALR